MLISLKIDWIDLIAIQGTFKSLLLHHSSKASILWCSALFMDHLSKLYVTIWKTIAFTIWTFVSRVMSLLFNTLSRFCHSFPAKKQSSSDFMAAVTICSDFKAQEEEICHYFHLFPFYLPLTNGSGCQDLSYFLIVSFKLTHSLFSFNFIKRLFSTQWLDFCH